jgi:hypothetical protein
VVGAEDIELVCAGCQLRLQIVKRCREATLSKASPAGELHTKGGDDAVDTARKDVQPVTGNHDLLR